MNTKNDPKPIRIQISEPWDFEIPGKGNMLDARVEGICQGPDERTWKGAYLLVSLHKSFTWEGKVIKQLLIVPRYEGDSVKTLWNGKSMTVGIARVKPGVSLTIGTPFTKEQVDYFAIGSAQILEK